MSPLVGWTLAALAVVAGFVGYGWRGLVLAITVIVFWLLLQFSRSLRALRDAAGRPVGEVGSALMLQARLHEGMRLTDILKITKSLGIKLADPPEETFAWKDAGGDEVQVVLRNGRVSAVRFTRAGTAAAEQAGP
jgi:hypothetical protein